MESVSNSKVLDNHGLGTEETTDRGHPALVSTILARKSVSPKRLAEPGPSDAELRAMLQAALAAPDHGCLRPWRAVVIPRSRREQLAELFRNAKLQQCPGATHDDLDRAGQKAFNAPTLLAILIDPVRGHATVTIEEQFIALGAALQNMLLAAHALGYAAMITSGEKLRAQSLQSCFVRTPGERLAVFVSMGTPSFASLARDASDTTGRISDWHGFI